jgi:hypothetical protein
MKQGSQINVEKEFRKGTKHSSVWTRLLHIIMKKKQGGERDIELVFSWPAKWQAGKP